MDAVASRTPNASFTIQSEAIEQAFRTFSKYLSAAKSVVVSDNVSPNVPGAVRIVRDPRISDIQQAFIRRKRQTVWFDVVVRHDADVARRVNSVDMACSDFALRTVPFVVYQNSVTWVGKPNRSIRFNHDVVWRVQLFAIEGVRDNRDGSVMFRTCDAACQMFAGYKPPLPIDRMAIGIVGRLPKRGYGAICLIIPHDAVVRDIRPKQVSTRGKPHRSLGPTRPCPKPLDPGVTDQTCSELGLDDFEPCSLNDSVHVVPLAVRNSTA